ncbi:MAG TPA: alpha/beta fold hydrolase [Candidatus Binataceae bacterium]|nr:alpha/beta fold hydrolase [Candidatus Binataceae bacterium]
MWRMAESCIDLAQNLSGLLCDPIFYGADVARGDGSPVLLIPGFFAGDWSLSTLARWLSRIGYRPYLSGIDWNVGCPDEKSDRLGWRLAHVTDECGMPAVVLGHSLGGVLARALAVEYPARVRHVVTLGSPARLAWSAVRARYRPAIRGFQSLWQAFHNRPAQCGTDECECRFGEAVNSRLPRGVRLSSLYTRADEVVDWRACITADGDNYEVSGRHISMAVNREVYRLLAIILAQQPGARPAASAIAPTSV